MNFFSHDTVLKNMCIPGRSFVDKHEEQTADMMRLMLDFMKTARQRLDQNIGNLADPGPALKTDIKMTPEGYPLLPMYVVQSRLSKSVAEQILRDYLSQHYCEFCIFVKPPGAYYPSQTWQHPKSQTGCHTTRSQRSSSNRVPFRPG